MLRGEIMSDYDNSTDEEIASWLEKLNIELVRKGLLHAAEDCFMIQAVKRLRERGTQSNPQGHNQACLCGHPQSEHGSMGVCLHSSACECTNFKTIKDEANL